LSIVPKQANKLNRGFGKSACVVATICRAMSGHELVQPRDRLAAAAQTIEAQGSQGRHLAGVRRRFKGGLRVSQRLLVLLENHVDSSRRHENRGAM
jgi:hypothetical protein